MSNVDETTHRPALNGASRSYIVTAGVCFTIVALLLVGYAQEDAARKAKEASPGATTNEQTSGQSASSEDQASRNRKVDELAEKSKGKFEALDKADQEFLDGVTSGHGQQMLQMRWEALQSSKTNPDSTNFDPDAKVREIVERTKGDYSKVTTEERSRMDSFTSGHGKEYFESRAKRWKESLQGKDKATKVPSSPPAVSQ